MKVNLNFDNLSQLTAFVKDVKLQQKPRGGFILSGTLFGLEIQCTRKELILSANRFFKEAQGYAFAETGGDFYCYSLISEKMSLLSCSSHKNTLLLTKIRRLFGNLFYNWKREMAKMEAKLFQQKLLYSAPVENELSQNAKSELIDALSRMNEEVPRLDNIDAFLQIGKKLAHSNVAIKEVLKKYLNATGVVDDVIAQAHYFSSKETKMSSLEEMKALGFSNLYCALQSKDGNQKALKCMESLSFLIDR